MRATMTFAHVLNRGRKGVIGPADNVEKMMLGWEFYTGCIKVLKNFSEMTQQIDINNYTRIFLIFKWGLIQRK